VQRSTIPRQGKLIEEKVNEKQGASQALAAAITRAASKQTYYTIRFFADRKLVGDAYRAYGYFRWVDDVLDAESGSMSEKIAFANRQKNLLEDLYRGESRMDLCVEEQMLADLVRNDTGENPGLESYLRNMMAVMVFDAERRGRVISQAELSDYSRKLAVAVTDALYYFIGHDDPAPRHEARYLAVTAAHITHMLRDAWEDTGAGYFNVPGEYLQAHGISPQDVDSQTYREWVCSRVRLARRYFQAGQECTAQVKNLRCRLAGYAYTARFEWMLGAIERDHYCLRSEYPERKSLRAGLWMGRSALAAMFAIPRIKARPRKLEARPVGIEER
jgi:phytoene/squalene synthetase